MIPFPIHHLLNDDCSLYNTYSKINIEVFSVVKKLLFLETSTMQFHKCVFRKIRVRKQPKTFKKIVNKLKSTAENVNQEMMVKKAKRSSLKKPRNQARLSKSPITENKKSNSYNSKLKTLA